MALSNMTVVSDGNLEFVSISFNYLDRSEINVYFDSVPNSTWAWVGDTNQIKFTPKVPNGVTVLIARTTDAFDLRHTFSEGAAFTAKTLDEDLRQVLHIVQEAKETNLSGIFYSDIDMNNNKITNLTPGSNPSDAVTFQQLQDLSPDAGLRAALAKDYANTGSGIVGFRQGAIGAVGRSVESKLRESVSVKDFGAVGDGVTDDSAAFMAADATTLDIYVPQGEYIVSGITLTSKRMFGPGTLKWKAAASEPMITITGSGCIIEQVTVDGNASEQTSNQIAIVTDEAPDTVLSGLRARNGRYKFLLTDVALSPGMSVYGCRFEDWGTVVSCDVLGLRSPDILVTGCHFRGIGDGHCIRTGLYVVGDTNLPVGGVISNNLFEDTDHVGVTCELYTQGLTITGNTFSGLEQGVKIEADGLTCTDIIITGNVFRNLNGAVPNNLRGRRITFSSNICVDCAGMGADMGTECVCSDNIFLRCGNPGASAPSIRVMGVYPDTVVSGNKVIDAPWRGIEIGGAHCTANGNRVKNAGDRSIFISGTNATVLNNITTGGTYGILANSSATDLTLEGNNCSGASTANYSIVGSIQLTSTLGITNIGYSGATFGATISSGEIAIPRRQSTIIVVDTEGGGSSDDLDTINISGSGFVGQIIVLRCANGSRVVTVKDGAQLRLAGDCILDHTNDTLTLIWTGTQWFEIGRKNE